MPSPSMKGGVSGNPTEVVFRRDWRVATITIDRAADANRLIREVLLGLEVIVDRPAPRFTGR